MAEVTHGARARALAGNTAVLMISQVIVRAASLVAFWLLTNSVEPKTYGLYLYALNISAAWAVLANFQLKAPLLREVAAATDDRAAAVRQAFTIRLILAVAVFAVTSAWGMAHFPTSRERAIFALLLFANLLLAVGVTFDEGLHALERFRPSAIVALVQGLAVSGGICLGVWLGRPIAFAVGAQVAGALLAFALTWRFARAAYGAPVLRLRWDRARVGSMLRLAVGVAVAAQIGAWYGRVDLLWVERLLGATPLGQYGVAYRALEVILSGTMILHAVLLPMLARAQAAGASALAPRLLTVLRFGLLIFLPVCGLISALSPQILKIFKPDYAIAAEPLAILVWIAPLTFFNAVLHWVLYFHGKPLQPLFCFVVALAVALVGCRVAVPALGLPGAAWARVAAEAAALLPAAIFVHRLTPLRWASLLGKPLVMMAAFVAAWLLPPSLAWPLRALLAVAAYGLAGWLIRPFEPREWSLVSGLLRPGGREASSP